MTGKRTHLSGLTVIEGGMSHSFEALSVQGLGDNFVLLRKKTLPEDPVAGPAVELVVVREGTIMPFSVAAGHHLGYPHIKKENIPADYPLVDHNEAIAFVERYPNTPESAV